MTFDLTGTLADAIADAIENQERRFVVDAETGTSEEQVAKDTDRDHWLDADEATQYGLISRVVKTRAEIVKGDSGAK